MNAIIISKAFASFLLFSFYSEDSPTNLGLVVFLVAIYVSNLIGPPPESTEAIGIVGNFQWLIILCGYWIDKNREAND
jgi:hypothetical protein